MKQAIIFLMLLMVMLTEPASSIVVNIDGSGISGMSNQSVNPFTMNATNLTTGTIPGDRYGTGILTANISDYSAGSITNATVNPYSMNASNLTSGTFPNTRYGTGILTANISDYSAGTLTNATVNPFTVNRSNVTGQSGIDDTQNTSINGKEPAISQGVYPQLWVYNKTWQNITTSWITEGSNLFFTDLRAINALQSTLNAMNTSNAANNTASQGRDDAQNISITASQINDSYFNGSVFPLSTEFKNSTAVTANNTANTANTTANNAEPAISTGSSNYFWNGSKVFVQLIASFVSDFNNTVQGIINTNTASFVTNNSAQITIAQVTGQSGIDATQNISITNIQGVDTAQNSSFRDSSMAIIISNATASAGQYINGSIRFPYNGTITQVSLDNFYGNGQVNISGLYNATSRPIYPTDIVVWMNISANSDTNLSTGLAINVVTNGRYALYDFSSAGNVNATSAGLFFRRS